MSPTAAVLGAAQQAGALDRHDGDRGLRPRRHRTDRLRPPHRPRSLAFQRLRAAGQLSFRLKVACIISMSYSSPPRKRGSREVAESLAPGIPALRENDE